MNPVPIAPCTRRMTSPIGMEDECDTLQVNDEHDPIWGNMMRSAWMPTDEERAAIASGAPVILSVVGKTHPVVALTVGGYGVMGTHRVRTGDDSVVTFTCHHPSVIPGDVITFAGDTMPNPDRKCWQFWKPRKVLRKWVVK